MDKLQEFANWFFKNANVLGFVPFAGAVDRIEDVTSILMYRHGEFQVQMFVVPAHTVIPEHTHPNVDSIEVYMGGNIRFSHSGSFVSFQEEICAADVPLALPKPRGKTIRVKPTHIHGAIIGEGGGVFLSIQQWLNGVAPHCVARDYSGMTMGADHSSKVVLGDVVTPVLPLGVRDAARKCEEP